MFNKYSSFLGSDIAPSSFDDAYFHIIPFPLEKSVSYGRGTGKGPAAILRASHELEVYDGISSPGSLGIYTHKPVKCGGSIAAVYDDLNQILSPVINSGKMPVVLGGEHTVSPLVVRSIKEIIKDFGVIHFDAHADLKDSYHGNQFSHACAVKRIIDLNCPVIQFGIRSLTEEEDEYRIRKKMTHYDAFRFFDRLPLKIEVPGNFPEKVYITLDVDVFDPSLIPSTGTPEPGGLMWYQVIDILKKVISEKTVIGFDVVELAPVKGSVSSDFTCAKLILTIMGMIQRKKAL